MTASRPWPARLPAPDEAALFLDFDGTLVEIAERPDAIQVPDMLHDLLDGVQNRLEDRVAIVSGRSVSAIAGFLPGFRGVISGGHGAETRWPDGRHEARGLPDEVTRAVIAACESIRRDFPDILLEEKPTGIAVHYRAEPGAGDEVLEKMTSIERNFPDAAIQSAHMAVEIKPAFASKARAVALLMSVSPFAGTRPIFAGDDETDEGAIREVEARGGTGIRIGGATSAASLRMSGPGELLKALGEWVS